MTEPTPDREHLIPGPGEQSPGWPERTIVDRLVALAHKRPDDIVLTFVDDDGRDAGSLTFAELRLAACHIASYLNEDCRLPPGSTALLVYPPSLDFVCALLGCMMAGIRPAPVAPPNPLRIEQARGQLVSFSASCDAIAILTDRKYLNAARLGQLKGLVMRGARRRTRLPPWHATDSVPARPPIGIASGSAQEVALLQFTSGSTADPKGVMITHANIVHQLQLNRADLRLGGDSVAVLWVPHFHDFGLISGLLSAVAGNARLYLMSPLTFLRNPARWFEVMSRVGATHTAAPDFAWRLSVRKTLPAQRRTWDLSRLRVAMSAAEPIRAGTLDEFAAAFAEAGFAPSAFCPAYGMAEHTVGVSVGGKRRLAVSREALTGTGKVVPARTRADSLILTGCGEPSPGGRCRGDRRAHRLS